MGIVEEDLAVPAPPLRVFGWDHAWLSLVEGGSESMLLSVPCHFCCLYVEKGLILSLKTPEMAHLGLMGGHSCTAVALQLGSGSQNGK